MKKKFTLEIASSCSENFDKMVPNSNGSFCNSCAKNVIDLSRKTDSEIARFIVENKNENICARLKTTQLENEFEYNEVSKMNNLKYAAIAASVLLTSSVVAQEKVSVETEISIQKPTTHILGKVAFSQTIEEEISIIIKGKLLDARTHKPLADRTYPNLTLTINNSPTPFMMNPKTGEFSIPLNVLKNSKTLMITVNSNDYYHSKMIPFNIQSLKGNVLHQDIIIDSEKMSKIYRLGGLGVNYVDKKGSREI
ncbi:hypothetical protein [Flavobacterium sp. JAS]|uniref:hypothetical protein n=1 Tax=Flavobacterium sp. JAS TaxID=2897329 RepID=UPI001E595F9B|nr:hypothetical protein [Flavobacterium sp. JAS]MCD0469147.1 hypothetical protein [Flavobacterium sp. JAS]